MLSEQEIRALSGGTGNTFLFDLSVISSDQYESLFRTLEHFAKKQIAKLGFSCDELFRAEQKALGGRPIPLHILNSIAKTRSNYTRNIVELLSFILPRSTRLLEVKLSYLSIRKEHLIRLINAFGQSTTLENISFSKVLLGDALLDLLLQTLDPNQIKSITIQYCGITRKSMPKIIEFIQRKDPKLSTNGGLVNFTISQTEITAEDQRTINEAIKNSSENNESIIQNNSSLFNMVRKDGKLVRNENDNIDVVIKVKNSDGIQQNYQHSEFKKSDVSPKKKTSPKKSQSSTAQPSENIAREQQRIKDFERAREQQILDQLLSSNRELKNQLKEISKELNAIKFNDDTYIVGQMAEQFVRFIRELEYKIQVLNQRKLEHGGL